MLALLLHGGRETPESIPVLSPWVDAALGDAQEVARSLERAESGATRTAIPRQGGQQSGEGGQQVTAA